MSTQTIKRLLHKLAIQLLPTPKTKEILKLIPKTENNTLYKRYVIFGHQRCGSSVLTSALKSHPCIKSFAELYTPNHITFNYPGYDNNSIKLIKYRNSKNIDFLNDVIFTGQDENITAVGFKVFPDQIEKPKFDDVWKWLEQNKDVKLIMLNRENSLATLCSVVIANKTGVWGIKDKSKRPSIQITLTKSECEQFFSKREMYAQMVREQFKNRDLYEISYETFTSDIPKYFNEIQDHIGLTPVELPINDVKKEVRSLNQIIKNYDELKSHFQGSKWEPYFN